MSNILEAALNPRSIAVIGASDNPHKVGGRPTLFMNKYGYRGEILPVNPARNEVQGWYLLQDALNTNPATAQDILYASDITWQN